MISVKICGLNSEEAVSAAVTAGAHYAGFVYFPASPRHMPLERAAALKSLLPHSIKSVSVLVDPEDALLALVQVTLRPDYLQLHGRETPQRLREIRKNFPGLKLIKAIPVHHAGDITAAQPFYDYADMLLFDAKAPSPSKLPGGNALSFDWSLLGGKSFPLPWFLSGGLHPGNVREAIRISGAEMVDVSSGVESAPGVKDAALIASFITAARYEA
ncbi:MAG: phosphoribosylanthranilate isomerase [Pseudomonadota bacterium]|nr:phosphoribosylanthranilate isomerase [Pseudomonadota bacterium]